MSYTQIFFQAFIYLLATVITVPLAKRIGLGSVLGYLLAGIVIGPYVLGLAGTNTEMVMEFAEFGVVMMLFIVGLELRPATLWQLRGHLIMTGGLQVILTTLVICIIALYSGLSFTTSAVIGMIAASSSTAIVLQILNEKGWIKFAAGITIFSVLLFQDIAVIPMLAIFPLLGDKVTQVDHHQFAGYQQTLLIIVLISTIIILGRYCVRPVFRFIANAHLHEAFTAMALLLVIGTALAMQYVGLSPALGAFLAGVVLAESEFRHELEADIEPFKGLLLGLFFISVGTNINFTVVNSHLSSIIAIIVLLISVKFLVLFILGLIFKRSLRDNLLIAMILAQGGEFCFVLITYAQQQHLLNDLLARELVAVVALSMLFTPLLILLYEKIIEPVILRRETAKEPDVVEKSNPVIIAGFGRFGQVVGRYLMANGIHTTVLDIDANQVESIRKFGFEVYYGDAKRLDLLHAAGLDQAKLLILAIDDTEKALAIARMVKKNHQQLKILIRVRGRTNVYEAINAGFELKEIYRETFDSALKMGIEALTLFGFSESQANRSAELFNKIDEEHLSEMAHKYDGNINQDFISQSRQNAKDLENILTADRESEQQKE